MAHLLCLRGQRYAEFVEDVLLACERDGRGSIPEAHGVAGEGCKVLQAKARKL